MENSLGISRQHTALPPWALPGAAPGVAILEHPVPDSLAAQAGAVALTCGMSTDRLWEAAWLSALTRCTGENWVRSAVLGEHLAEIELEEVPATWLDLLVAIKRAPAADVSAARTLLALAPGDGPAVDLRVDVLRGDDGVRVRATARTEAVSPAAAGRFLDHVVGMLSVIVTDGIAAPVDLCRTIGAEEFTELVRGRSGPRVANGPDLALDHVLNRMRELPDAPAASYHDDTLTYGELERLSGNVARQLVSRGVDVGEPVAVAAERNLDWIVLLVGVLRAGAVYLPVRPDFPASRVSGQFNRAGCRTAVHDGPGGPLLREIREDRGWDGRAWDVAELREEPSEAVELPRLRPEDAAYVYFTSGSTGQPKGALCEHGGMVNHLWTKIDDHGITSADVVAQTASACFDISLWQVVAPLMVGGQVLVVSTDDQLDPDAFLGLLDQRGVTVAQIVPSYLEVLLARLESGAAVPPSLRTLSVTGEALKVELVERWFAVTDRVNLVNAYGATEVSDDTMHNVLTAAPARKLPIVNVGRALRNVRVYIVDERLRLLPLGARGEIVFAGVCVGRGYLNDPERTAEAFVEDPYAPGERLYRSGDFGRWLPEGGIEFLGRRDEQVKLRGLRVEIGEIQSALLNVPGVETTSVVIAGTGANARLTAFYTASFPVAPRDVHDILAGSLPEYMVPPFMHQLDAFPLSENGKVDKPALRALAEELQSDAAPFQSPATPTEELLAAAWAEALGVPVQHIGRYDDFFQSGGTSLAAVHLVMRLKKRLSLRDVTSFPVLSDQAELIESGVQERPHRLLQRFKRVLGSEAPLAVCLPSAAGNALNFRLAAEDACAAGIDLVALEPRGHDVARPDEELMGLRRTVDLLVGDVVRMGHTEIHIWGQGTGAAMALALALELTRAGTPPASTYLVGATLRTPDSHLDAAAAAEALTDDDVMSTLQHNHDYVEVAGLDEQRRHVVSAAYRHDLAEAERFLAEVAAEPSRHALTCPVTVVFTSDVFGTNLSSHACGWEAIAPVVTCDVVTESGSEILRSRPELLVQHVAAHRAEIAARG